MKSWSFRFQYYILFWWVVMPYVGQAQRSDSTLLNQLAQATHDTIRVKIYNQLAYKHQYANIDKQKKYAFAALKLVDTSKVNAILGRVYISMQRYYHAVGQYDQAIQYSLRALKVFQKINDLKGTANIYNSLGIFHEEQGAYAQAINFQFKSLHLKEQLNDQAGISASLNNIAAIYESLQKYDKALEYFERALKINKERNDLRNICINQVNIAQVYCLQKKYNQSEKLAIQSIQNARKSQTTLAEAVALKYLAIAQSARNDTAQATKNFTKSYALFQQQDYALEYAALLVEMAKYYLKLQLFQDAENYGLKGLKKALKIGAKKEIKDAYQVLSGIYEKQGKIAEALTFHKKYAIYNDSLSKDHSRNILIKEELRQSYNKQKQQKQESSEQINQQYVYLYAISIGLVLVSLFSFFLLRGSRKQHRLNQELKKQQEELKTANLGLQQKQEEIKANNQELKFLNHRLRSGESVITKAYDKLQNRNKQLKNNIRAALTIQQAILPSASRIRSLLPEHFIIYLPKDIVSGDFYWINQVKEKIVVVFADCTGHGVQGAFMSLIGHSLLDRIILQQKNTNPASILTQLNEQVLQALHQREVSAIEGMDIGVVVLEHLQEKQRPITYAGAKRPLYYVSADIPDKICQISGVRKSIGGGLLKNNKQFENIQIQLPQGSMLYMGSDGMTDQHNHLRKKLGSLRLKEILTELSALPLTEQENTLFATIQSHMVNTEQRDDILWMGIRV